MVRVNTLRRSCADMCVPRVEKLKALAARWRVQYYIIGSEILRMAQFLLNATKCVYNRVSF